MLKRSCFKNQKGSLLIEVLAALGIGVVIVSAMSGLGSRTLRDTVISSKKSQATRLSEQGLEGVRSVRDQNIKDAFVDSGCNLTLNPNDPTSPPTDLTTCNEWSDIWKVTYVSSKTFTLYPPNSSGNTNNYWLLKDSAVAETINGITRQVMIEEANPTDPTRIKKITVTASVVDGPNIFKSVQETYLRKTN